MEGTNVHHDNLRILLFQWKLNPGTVVRRNTQLLNTYIDEALLRVAVTQAERGESHMVDQSRCNCFLQKPTVVHIAQKWDQDPEAMARKYLRLESFLGRQTLVLFDLDGIDLAKYLKCENHQVQCISQRRRWNKESRNRVSATSMMSSVTAGGGKANESGDDESVTVVTNNLSRSWDDNSIDHAYAVDASLT